MKIAHVIAAFYPYLSGTGRVCFHNAIELAKLGHDVTIITSAYPPGEYDYPPELEVIRLPILFRVGNAPLLPGLLAKRDVDIFHLHYPFVFGQELIFLKSLFSNTPYVITYHQDLILNGLMGKMVNIHHATIGRQILRSAKRLIVTSMDYGHHSRISSIVRAMNDRVVEVPNGVDVNRFNPTLDGRQTRQTYRIPDDAIVILFVGGLDTPHYFKGVEVLLQSFATLENPNVYLMIIGDGDLKPNYEQNARELGVRDRIIFCGRVDDEELPNHYSASDIFVLPSITMGEAFGIVSLEAMACGKPVIASRLPGVRSVVSDGVDGLHVNPSDAADLAQKLTLLISAQDLQLQMGQRGREKVVSKYKWGKIAERLQVIYEQVLED